MICEFKRWRGASSTIGQIRAEPSSASVSVKLVKLDAGGWLTEIDKRALHREAVALQNCINANNNLAATCECAEILKLINAVVAGTLELPFKGSTPCRTQSEEFSASLASNRDFRFKYYRFISRIRGCSRSSTQSSELNTQDKRCGTCETIKGERYMWVVSSV
jgi:hypothetical protein